MPNASRSELQRSIADVLRSADSPLSSGESLACLPPALQGCTRHDLHVVLPTHPMCVATLRGRYVYLPTALRGAEVFLPILPSANATWLTLPIEAFAMLWPDRHISAAIWNLFEGRSATSCTWRSRMLCPFDGEHLHAIFLSGRCGDSATAVFCPEAVEEEPSSVEVTLGHFDPQPGDEFMYLFDFSDEWRLRIKVLERKPGGPAPSSPRLVGTQGEPPEQYPEYH